MKTLIWLLLAPGIALFSCNSVNMTDTFSFDLEKSFQIGDAYFSTDHSLQFQITEINDSRCPSDVICVWQGEAVVKIEVKSPLTGTLELNTHNNLTDTIGSYSFELVDVSPYPVSTKTIELDEYQVTLLIEKLPG
jgi:hypothetical protein